MPGDKVLLLAWGSPWPARSGASLRTLGLLTQLAKYREVHLLVACRKPLDSDTLSGLSSLAASVTTVPLRQNTPAELLAVGLTMLRDRCPYHCAVLRTSLASEKEVAHRLLRFDGVVYASLGHWGTLEAYRQAPNWILDQQNADADFWRIYAAQASSPRVRAVAILNWQLARMHFPIVYRRVGQIVSVCEEDRLLTVAMAGTTPVHVIENGVDCSFYAPQRATPRDRPRVLFTGTSAERNLVALRWFVRGSLPKVRSRVPNVELLVAGNFSPAAQAQFSDVEGMRFTGKVPDMRPFFDLCDVYIAPFRETYGSKLKVAEAMAMAMPIVSTRQGIRGFPLVSGHSVLVADSDDDFAAQTVELLRDQQAGKRLGEAARIVAEERLDWPVLGRKLAVIVEKARGSRCI